MQVLRNISIMKRKVNMISLEVDLWLSRSSENDHLRKELEPLIQKKLIMKTVLRKLKENKDIDVNNILSILPRPIMNILRLDSLEKVSCVCVLLISYIFSLIISLEY